MFLDIMTMLFQMWNMCTQFFNELSNASTKGKMFAKFSGGKSQANEVLIVKHNLWFHFKMAFSFTKVITKEETI